MQPGLDVRRRIVGAALAARISNQRAAKAAPTAEARTDPQDHETNYRSDTVRQVDP